MNISKLKTYFGVFRAWIRTSIDLYLHGDSPGKSRFIVKELPPPSEKIYTNEYIEEYTNYLILKNVYIDLDRSGSPNNIDQLKTTKYFSSIQKDVTKRFFINELRDFYILPEGKIQAIQTHENLCFLHKLDYLISFLIWRLQYCYIQCQLSDIDFNTCSILTYVTWDLTLHKFYTNLFKVIKSPETKGIHLFKQLLIWKPHVPGTHSKSQFISKHMAKKYQSSILHRFGINPPPKVQQVKKITLVLRKDYICRLESTTIKSVQRKIADEENFITRLKHYLPRDIELQAVELGELTIKKQLEIIANTDILLGAHGSALAYNVFLPDNAGVFEIIPVTFQLKHWYTNFYALTVNRGLFYKRHIHLNTSRNQDLINLSANKIAKKLTSLINTINTAST